jgi:hypothetical protein
MKLLSRSSLLALIAVAALALPAAASAAPASTTFSIVGYEYAFTSTVGSFAGTGAGNAGDTAVWNASVEHDPLGSTPTYVNGGSFQMATRSPSWRFDTVRGTFAYRGGMITRLNPDAPPCANEQYLVTGTLRGVTTSTTTGGSGIFSAVLTHYRVSFFGRCVIYKARVVGNVMFAYRGAS